jgi:hypothetical protein
VPFVLFCFVFLFFFYFLVLLDAMHESALDKLKREARKKNTYKKG